MIAQVMVDSGLSHLDRPFDYSVPDDMSADLRVGVRVRVRFHGRLMTALVVGLSEHSQYQNLQPITRLISSEVVAPEASIRLIKAVAAHMAGSFMDVARLAVPPRHARAENVERSRTATPATAKQFRASIDDYPRGSSLRQALQEGACPRVSWLVAPTTTVMGQGFAGLAALVASTIAGGRRAIVVLPDAKDVKTMTQALRQVVDDPRWIVSLQANQGPQARYSAYLAIARGQAMVAVGTRSVAYAPMPDLGLLACWDEADPSLAEPHFPYPQIRDVIALRARIDQCAVVFAGHSRSVSLQSWIETGWLTDLSAPVSVIRREIAAQRVVGGDDWSRRLDPLAGSVRLPHQVFEVIRQGLALGPVLVQVPWLNNRRDPICRACGQAVRCACGGGLIESSTGGLSCTVCGSAQPQWRCACGSNRWRVMNTGAERTAHELARAFPQADVQRYDSSMPSEDTPTIGLNSLVIATPGSAPLVEGGYASGIILDGDSVLRQPRLDVAVAALRHWMAVTAVVRSGQDHGQVLLLASSDDRVAQAWLRLDPAGLARRELTDRREAGFPPACRMAIFTGQPEVIAAIATEVGQLAGVSVLGPDDSGDPDLTSRLLIRIDAQHGDDLAHWLHQAASEQSTLSIASRAGKLQWRLDPDW
ncbi:MAG: primosomal protein N' [Propionibacteriaceae bacterium]|jgi:primosomal protein N' (replication factor Y)|nr:primosomal protein N' [Propionibacteriaceae bacterium]